MPGVNPPADGGYNYYQKTLSDLEDELKNEQKRARQREQERTNSLEESYKSDLADRERDLAETVQNIRDDANEAIANDRRYSKNEINRIKNETYDKFGRYNGIEADVVNHQLEDLKKASERQHAKDQQDLTYEQKTHEQRLSAEQERHADEMEKYARTVRDAANDTYSHAYKEQASEYDQLKQDTQKGYENLVRQHQEELNQEKKKTERYIADAQTSFDHQKQRLNDSNDTRFEKAHAEYERRMKQATEDTRESRNQETEQLRGQIKKLLDNEPNSHRGEAEGISEAIQKYNDEWRHREQAIGEDFQRQLDKMKQSASDSDRHYNQLNNENLRQKDAYFTKAFAQANQENHRATKELENTFAKDHADLELQIKHNQERAAASMEAQGANLAEHQNTVLTQQAKSYQDTIDRNHKVDQDTIQRLQKELYNKTYNEDPTMVSPSADAAIRKSVIRDYEKTLSAERGRHDRAINSLQQEYQSRVKDTLDQKEADVTALQRQTTVERDIERSRIVSTMEDIQENKEEMLRSKDYESSRQAETLNRNYASTLEKQRRQYDEILATAKSENAYKLTAARQEGEFNLKLAQKTFSRQQNELIRDYDKKLADQKAQYETQIDELKAQTQAAMRENDRKHHQEMDEQARNHEQRLTQTEYQHKERERYITENYQEQLEKVKRSNALLVSKKS